QQGVAVLTFPDTSEPVGVSVVAAGYASWFIDLQVRSAVANFKTSGNPDCVLARIQPNPERGSSSGHLHFFQPSVLTPCGVGVRLRRRSAVVQTGRGFPIRRRGGRGRRGAGWRSR